VAVHNPFKEQKDPHCTDQELIDKALAGGGVELESLILRHQAWIFNIALGMTCDALEAEDATQEILVKMITALATYDKSKAAFRTWLYRIVANHVLSLKRFKKETAFSSLVNPEAYHAYVESIPDEKVHNGPENKALTREVVGLYRELPFAEPPDMVTWIRRAITSDQFKGLMDLQ